MPEIVVDNLSFGYGKKQILDRFSLSLSGFGIYTLTGPSGCGKTTLLRLLCGLERPSVGTVRLSDRPSVAFQEHRLFPELSAAENVALVRHGGHELTEARSLLLSFGFREEETALLPSELSGGMRQRVSLSRALFSDSPILFFDEPSKELDEDLRTILYRKLLERSRRSLILLTTHRPEETEILRARNISLR